MRGNEGKNRTIGAEYREGVKRATEPYLREITLRKNRRAPEGLDTKGEMCYTYRKEITMADFCKKCEIEMFGKVYLNIPDNEIILCEGCGGNTPYGKPFCVRCNNSVDSAIYPDTDSLEHFCNCQCTLDADFDNTLWVFEGDK